MFARRIVGWRVPASLRTDFVLDELEQAMYDRCGAKPTGLVLHSINVDLGNKSAVSVDEVVPPPAVEDDWNA